MPGKSNYNRKKVSSKAMVGSILRIMATGDSVPAFTSSIEMSENDEQTTEILNNFSEKISDSERDTILSLSNNESRSICEREEFGAATKDFELKKLEENDLDEKNLAEIEMSHKTKLSLSFDVVPNISSDWIEEIEESEHGKVEKDESKDESSVDQETFKILGKLLEKTGDFDQDPGKSLLLGIHPPFSDVMVEKNLLLSKPFEDISGNVFPEVVDFFQKSDSNREDESEKNKSEKISVKEHSMLSLPFESLPSFSEGIFAKLEHEYDDNQEEEFQEKKEEEYFSENENEKEENFREVNLDVEIMPESKRRKISSESLEKLEKPIISSPLSRGFSFSFETKMGPTETTPRFGSFNFVSELGCGASGFKLEFSEMGQSEMKAEEKIASSNDFKETE